MTSPDGAGSTPGVSGPPPVHLPATVAVVASGGAAGSLGRWLLGLALPHEAGTFPWATFCVNVTGAFLAGLVISLILRRPRTHPLVRPFLVVGVLGGWTTFSTYLLDAHDLVAHERPGTALAYLAGSLLLGLLAVAAGVVVARRPARVRT